jgi:hypothetical protein
MNANATANRKPMNGQSKRVGHRFKFGHPKYPPKIDGTAHQRLVRQFVRKLKIEYGPDLNARALEHIKNIAAIRARLQLQGEQLDNTTYVLLVNTERRELECL